MTQSGQQLARDNLAKFQNWIAEREASGDWAGYIRQGKLNRSEIANECGFALSVVRQNPAVKTALEGLETRLLASGVIQSSKTTPSASNETADATSQSIDKRIMVAKGKAEARVKALEEQNAALKAELRDLKEKLKTYQQIDEHLCTTGRFLRA